MIKNIVIVILLGVIGWLVWLIENDNSRYDPRKQSVKEKMHEAVKATSEKTLQGLQKTGEIVANSSKVVLDEVKKSEILNQ